MRLASLHLRMMVGAALALGGAAIGTKAQVIRPSGGSADWMAKVDAAVVEAARTPGGTDFLVLLQEQADLSAASSRSSRRERGAFVVDALQRVAHRTQPALLAELRARGVAFTSFWIANLVVVHGDTSTLQAVARRGDVARVLANGRLVAAPLPAEAAARGGAVTQGVEWNIASVQAPETWAEGFVGQGVVVGGHDTGYTWNHPALIHQYRGWNGTTADHHYNWHDAIHGVGGDRREPFDDNGHGTHTMGTAVGNDLAPGAPGWPAAASNAIGVAPGARWIGCRNMRGGVGTVASYTECFQWFVAPTDLDGQNPDPAMAPDIITNSWSCSVSEGCTDPSVLLAVIRSVHAAGILTVHSAGNNGPGCGTVSEPATIYAEVLSVGSTDATGTIAGSSSRGPVTRDGSGRLKPEISAPGVGIRSSYGSSSYQLLTGTSMASPHVAGAAALVLSARPELAGNVAALTHALTRGATAATTSQGCGGDTPSAVPNHVYGWGRLDVRAAVHRIIDTPALTVTAVGPASGPVEGGTIVTITGTGFGVGDVVSVGGTAATAVTLVDATRMTAVVPSHVAGTVDVIVTRTDWQRATRVGGFTYGSPVFTDDPLVGGAAAIKAVHLVELRLWADELRKRHSLPAAGFGEDLVPGGTPVKAGHVVEVRAALADVCSAAGYPCPAYTDATLQARQTVVRAVHINELRDLIRSLWSEEPTSGRPEGAPGLACQSKPIPAARRLLAVRRERASTLRDRR